MYNLDLKVISVEQKTEYETCTIVYSYGLIDDRGWWKGSLTLPTLYPLGTRLSIVVMAE